MNKILSDHRRQLGNFDLLDIDEKKTESLRAQIDIAAPLDLHWTWSYAEEASDLRALYERGKAGQWNAQTDLDWNTDFDASTWCMKPDGDALFLPTVLKMMGKDEETCREAAHDEFAYSLSQLLHGEQAALQICGQLTNACPGIDAKFYAASQVIDEARHVEVIAKFLECKVGKIYPIGGTLKALLDRLLSAEGWKMKTLGMQCLFEGMAVSILDGFHRNSQNPLVTDMVRRVKMDEARHAAFGILLMRKTVAEAEKEELEEMEDFAFDILEALNATQQIDMLQLFGPKYGFNADDILQMALAMPEWAEFNSKIFMHTVVPNLSRLGLITERTESGYRKCGIMFGDRFGTGMDADVAASM
ncbi:MAG: ferritin-like domain-containing protein [Deltaproteobacteria bacterium]